MTIEGTDRSFDEQLRQLVLHAFSLDESLAALEIRVGVSAGIVHLGGKVSTRDQWEHAGQVAMHFPGVRGVVNRIEAPGAPNPSRPVHLDLLHANDEKGQP